MESLRVLEYGNPELNQPVLIEGLPGIGNVGSLAVQQLVDALGATLWCDIVGSDLPPQVTVQDDGTVRLVRCQLWTATGVVDQRDAIFLTGDFQPLTSQGQYDLATQVLDRCEAKGCRELYTTGGFGVGTAVDDPEVLGAATDADMVNRLREANIRFPEDQASGIIGASGLLLGLAQLRGMTGACLMGETSGFLVDPRSARAVLMALGRLLNVSFPLDDLDAKAAELDTVTRRLQDLSAARPGPAPGDGDLHYIG